MLKHAQHLLRHLHDPPALEENPLFQTWGAGAVRKMLERLCATMASAADQHARDSSVVRQYEIFRRCDLMGEPHAAVASDLGVSRRQFYRERRILARRVADLFTPPAPETSEEWLKRLAFETRYSDALIELGRDEESRHVDVSIRRQLTAAQCVEADTVIVQYAGIRLARRELARGNVRAAMTDLDLVGALVWDEEVCA